MPTTAGDPPPRSTGERSMSEVSDRWRGERSLRRQTGRTGSRRRPWRDWIGWPGPSGWAWAGFVVVFGLAVRTDVDDDARVLVMVATVLAVLASLTAVVGVDRRRPVIAGVALVVAGVAAPTYAAVWFDVVPVGVGVAMLVRSARQRRSLLTQP